MSTRLASRLAWSLWILSVALVMLGVFFLVLNHAVAGISPYFFNIVVSALAFSTVGALITSRRPEHPIGRFLGVTGLLYAVTVFASEYSTHAIVVERSLSAGGIFAAWLSSWLWIVSGSLALFLFLIFPDGRLPSARWRFVAWLAALYVCLAVAYSALMPGPLEVSPEVENPLGIERIAGLLEIADTVSSLISGVVLLTPVALFLRLRRARDEERQQVKWVAYATIVLAVAIIVANLWPAFEASFLVTMLFLLGSLAIPASVGIAILKYRLYDIDLLINRTLVYGALSIVLALVYAGGVVSLQGLFRMFTGQESQLAVVASTLVIAALFAPLRRRVQRFIDRRFYRRKYDAANILSTFNNRLRDETDLSRLSEDVVGVVREAMQASSVSLWLREPMQGPRKTDE